MYELPVYQKSRGQETESILLVPAVAKLAWEILSEDIDKAKDSK